MEFCVYDHTKDVLTITVFDKDLFSPNGRFSSSLHENSVGLLLCMIVVLFDSQLSLAPPESQFVISCVRAMDHGPKEVCLKESKVEKLS